MDPEDRPPSNDEAVERTNGSPNEGGGINDDSKEDDREDHGIGSRDDVTDLDTGQPGTESADESNVARGSSTDESETNTRETDKHEDPAGRLNPERNDDGLLERFWRDNEGPLMWIREMLSSVAIVLLLGLILFGVSGVWPPMVAVESGSMEPNMEVGDLVFVTEPGRFAPDAANNDIGVVTYENGKEADYRTFGSYGSVVIYQPPGRTSSPIIHRAMFHVEEGENWYDRADRRFHNADDCEELQYCPAPHDGFITLGDNNGRYDQTSTLAEPVKAEWVTGVARVRIPYLGYVRLVATGQVDLSDLLSVSTGIDPGGFEVTATGWRNAAAA